LDKPDNFSDHTAPRLIQGDSKNNNLGAIMSNPVLVEVIRGSEVESRHRGSVAVCDPYGKSVMALGDIELPIFPRSAVKSIQALPLIESGAADAYGFGAKELALACASHNGEQGHVDTALAMLAKAGRGGGDLECGAHWPFEQKVLIAMAASGEKPHAVHNNCSGKHAGFICTACHEGVDPAGYVGQGHKAQQNVRLAMQEVTGFPHEVDHYGTDGCSIPTYSVPLKNLAQGFAKMATGKGLAPARAKAAKRLLDACMAEPWHVAGTGRPDTAMLEAGKGRVFVKYGAEAVYCGAIPELGLGFALKCDDGSERAAVSMAAALVAKLMKADKEMAAAFSEISKHRNKNWNGMVVGKVKAAGELG
jgi:L-asparaginase II